MDQREILQPDRVREIIHAEPNNQHQRRIMEANANVMWAFRRYLMAGRQPGGFVTECLRDSLTGAVGHADQHMSAVMGAVSLYLVNDFDARAWGHDEDVQTWKDNNGMVGIAGLGGAYQFAKDRI